MLPTKMLSNLVCLSSIFFLSVFGMISVPSHAGLPELIPRQVLFGNPEKTDARISPDGEKFAWLAPSDNGVLNVWVQYVKDRTSAPRMVTSDKRRGIRFFQWAPDNSRILYFQDEGGNENWHLYAVNIDDNSILALTPFEGVRAQNLIVEPNCPDEVLVGLNKRDRSIFDMYRVNLNSGETTLDVRNPGDVTRWLTDAKFVIRGAISRNQVTGDITLRVRAARDKPWREILRWPFGENGTAYDFSKDGESIIVSSSLGSDTTRLLLIDADTGEEIRELAESVHTDVAKVLIHPTKHNVEAVEFDYLKPRWEVIDDRVRRHFKRLKGFKEGRIELVSRTLADDRWIVTFQPDDGPKSYFVYDTVNENIAFLFANQPDLNNYTLSKVSPVVIKARDGLELVTYLTLPVGVPPQKLPTVINVHGGPWMRNHWGYDPHAQWFSNRGYATIQVNYRGSSGFGKRFKNAGNGEWGVGSMQHDITDAVLWLVEHGISDPKRVCIYGRSYGGYAVLSGLTFTPELYSCGVDIVGPSNIRTLFRSIPPYWKPMKKEFILRVGDVERDDSLNERISPLFHVENIKAPLFVVQGMNDPRVNIAESEQIVAAMRSKDLSVTYLVFPDEGHVFVRPENRLDMTGRIEEFLAKHLHGRLEPLVKVEGSSGELR